MIKIYSKQPKEKLPTTHDTYRKNSWVYVENPTQSERDELVDFYGLDRGLLTDAADIHEVPRYEIEDGIIYIYTRFAYSANDLIDTTPMLIVIKKDCLITISIEAFPRLHLFLNGKVDFNTLQRTILFSKLCMQINETYNTYLNNMSKKLRAFSLRVQKIKNNDIVQFVSTENVLYDFNTSLVRINNIYDGILNGKILQLTDIERDLVEDVSLASNQLIQITRENLRTTVNVREAYSTIMTNNLNQVIKLFTSLTVILTLPTILGTYYGMNVALPFQESPLAFFGIVLFSLTASVVAIIIFIKKDWL